MRQANPALQDYSRESLIAAARIFNAPFDRQDMIDKAVQMAIPHAELRRLGARPAKNQRAMLRYRRHRSAMAREMGTVTWESRIRFWFNSIAEVA